MWPDAMNAATRVNNPTVISRPVTSSMTPAYQTGQLPVGMPKAIGQSNNLDVPKRVNISPNTMRNRLKTAGEYELRRESTLVVMRMTLRVLMLHCELHAGRRAAGGAWEHRPHDAAPPNADARAEPAQRNRAFPSPSPQSVTSVFSPLQG